MSSEITREPSQLPAAGGARALVAYVLMIAATVALFFVIRAFGEALSPSSPAAGEAAKAAAPATTAHPLLHLLLALAAVIALGRLLAALLARIGQPPVIGEVIAGIALGPSLLGHIAPAWGEFLLPASVAPSLSVVAQLGVIFYMFVVGLELNAGTLRRLGHVTLAISHASIVVPFLLGAAAALWLYPLLGEEGVSFTSFALFLSVSMSITAFPVLARILTDRGLQRTELGVMALSCAAVDDVTAWCLLALVVGVVQSQVGQALWVFVWTALYIGAMFLLIRPLVGRVLPRYDTDGLTGGLMAVVVSGVLLSALATEAIGIHAIFGAFMLGAVIPHNSRIAEQLTFKLHDFVTTLLLPAFFALTGMRTEIGLLDSASQWLVCLALIGIATAGKFGGSVAAARWMGLDWNTSASLGVLMNTRGLMGLIVLNVGLDLGVISPTLFAMMVIMALVTTLATAPALAWLGTESGFGVRDPGLGK